ncbi:MAG TPA: histidinol-phosphate transaminase [Haliangiales bacterium]|nr:histidinol-phosphate transaminase [Haliangiales bacterium]
MNAKEMIPDSIRGLTAYAIPHPAGVRIKLDANESPHPLPPDVAAALGAHLAEVPLHRYPDPRAEALVKVVARDVGVPSDQIVLGNGSDEMIALLLTAFSRSRTSTRPARAAFPWPSFVYYRIACAARGVAPLEIPLRSDFTLDVDATDAALAAERPNLAFFALPNNPTGTLWPMDEVARLSARHPDTLFVSDEAYFDYSGETLLPRLAPNLVVMRTLSKLGLAGLRVGFLVAPPAVAEVLERIRPPYNVGALNQAAAAWLLTHHKRTLLEAARRVVAERERLAAALARLGLQVFPSRANLLLVRHPRASDVWSRLLGHGILVRNFDRPGPLAGCLRITVGTAEENDLLVSALTPISSGEQ